MKLEIEKPSVFSPSVLALIASLCVGSVLFISNGLGIGLIGFYGTFIVVQGISDVINTALLPSAARIYAEAALRHFKLEYPDAKIINLAVRDMNEERLIISVRYERPGIYSHPTPRVYYAVGRSDQTVTTEEIRRWWPKGLK